MVRLESHRRFSREPARHPQWRLWALVLGLGLVLIAMNELRRPEFAARLERAFSPPGPADGGGPPPQALPSGAFRAPGELSQEGADGNPFPAVQSARLEAVRDNAPFRSAESDAWFYLWQRVQSAQPAQLEAASRGVIDYAQLVDQPHVYRGQVVTVRGTARRVEVVEPAENELGLEKLYLLTLRPPGGQIWPIRVYALEVPPSFLTEDDLRHEVQVTGYFFKNWSYQWQGGLGLAPVILVPEVQLLEPLTAQPSPRPGMPTPAVVVLAALALAVAIMGYVYWNVRHASSRKIEADQDEAIAAMERAAGKERS